MRFEYIDPNPWNDTLTQYSKGVRARYWEVKIVLYDLEIPQGITLTTEEEIDWYEGKFKEDFNAHTVLFSINVTSKNHITIRFAIRKPSGDLLTDSRIPGQFNLALHRLYERIFSAYDISMWRFDEKAKLTEIINDRR